MIYDAAIIGAGIVGAAAARELSRYTANVCVIEKESDVSCGTSKANSGIVHAGYDPEPGTLMARFNAEGNRMFPALAEELHFDFRQTGSLVVAFSEDEKKHLEKLERRGKENGVAGLSVIGRDELRRMEPNIGEDAAAALFAPSAGITSPYQAAWSLAENAARNGVRFMLNTEVHAIVPPGADDQYFTIHTGRGDIRSKYVVNAAGVFSDEISRMAGGRPFVIVPRRGEYCLLDNACKDLVSHVIFQIPGPLGKGVLVTPTVDDNILIGPSAEDGNGKSDTGTTRTGQEYVIDRAERSVPDIPRRNIINSFSGIRALAYERDAEGNPAAPVGDFIVEEDERVPGLIHAAGISSPGLTAAPAIALRIVELLENAGLVLHQNRDFIPVHKGIESFKRASPERRLRLVEENPLYGRIICRCEMITEAEIVQAVHSAIGADTLDGVNRRTRAGMGRCQGGFCLPRITAIISREKNIPMINVTKNGGCSYILNSRTRQGDA